MCVMVLGTLERLRFILEKLHRMDISQVYFFNMTGGAKLGVPCISLVPFINLLVCEDSVLDNADFREGILLCEAQRLNVPVLSEGRLSEILRG